MSADRPRIALIGIGCRFPGGAHGPDATWRLLAEGVDPVREVPPDRWDADAWFDPDPEAPGKMTTREGAFLDEVARFDAARFGISPREALQMDPQQRLLLEVAWEALEDAGRAPDRLAGSRTGVYVGLGLSDYARRAFGGPDPSRIDAYSGTGTFSSVASGRLAYALGLQGPALSVHTACSSSLVAIHLAMEALRSGQIDLALAGGVNLLLAPQPSIYFSKLGALAPDGRCRTFDAGASGYGRGEGCGVLVLSRLEDAQATGDRLRAVLLGSAINQDGRSNGLTAPSGSAQQAVIRAALADAGVAPEQVGLIEAHGTGTPLGDPIEAAALAAIYGEGHGPCQLRSVKTAFGHTEAAAGVAGVIAAALALEHGQAPPQQHFSELNPRIDLSGTRLHIPTTLTPLGGRRRAGVSAFGLSGTNAHLLLEEAPPEDGPSMVPGRAQLLLLSAGSEHGLELLRPSYASTLRAARLEDVAASAGRGRALLPHRLAIVAEDAGDAAARLAAGEGTYGHASRPPPICFAYTGQGSQWHRMGQDLYATEPVFREAFDAVDDLLQRHRGGRSLVEVLYDEDEQAVHHTEWTQPALFAIGWALTALWRHWGVTPDAVMGHSIGELTAAAVAGVIGLEDAVALVGERGRLMGELPEGGAMAAVRAGVDAVKPALEGLEDLGIAGVNSPVETVISGAEASVEAALERLATNGIESRRLKVSHAFHSPLVTPILERFEKVASTVAWREPTLPLYSNLTGKLAGPEIRTATYWTEHIRRPVRFATGLQTASEDGFELFLEIGPHPVLSGMGARTLTRSTWLPSLQRERDGRGAMLEALGGLVVRGIRPEPDAVWPAGDALQVDLPLTPFDGEDYWLEPIDAAPGAVPAYGLRWVPADRRGAISGRWWVAGEADRVAVVAAALAEAGGDVTRGLPEVLEAGDHVVWVVPGADSAVGAWERGPEELRALWARVVAAGARLHVVTAGAMAVRHDDRVDPGQAACWGLGRVCSLEQPDAWGGLIDLPPGRTTSHQGIAWAFALPEDQVAVRGGRLHVPRLTQREAGRPQEPRTDGTWLITGGFGALGSAVAGWLADQGVRAIVLASRKGGVGEEREALLAALSEAGVDARAATIDVRNRAAVVELVDEIDDLVGVIHCAGRAVRGPIRTQSAEDFRANADAKMLGAEALDAATRSRNLDAFVCFSSIAATWGSAGLGAYAAANAWLDALCQRRRALGLPGVSLAWGPWGDGGMVGADERRSFARMGVRPLPRREALAALGRHLHDPGHRVLADVDWEVFAPIYRARGERLLLDDLVGEEPSAPPEPARASLRSMPPGQREDWLRRSIAAELRAVLGLDPAAPLDPSAGLFDLGMDSLMAVELHRRLRDRVGLELPNTVAFDHPSLDALETAARTALGWSQAPEPTPVERAGHGGPIAVVGWSARAPGAPDVEALEAVLQDGRCTVGPAPERAGGTHAGVVDGLEDFDGRYFGIGPAEAAALDPQQRMLLEGAVEALETGGFALDRLAGEPVGVFLGIGRSGYWDRLRDPAGETWPWSGVGNEQSFAAGRVAYALGLRGPAMAVNTACSSSLVAVHLAVQALRSGQCEVALAGGANALLSPSDADWLAEIGALGPSGRCRTFDATADGYVRSEGMGMVALVPLDRALAERRPILGVIRGSAVGHGGAAGGLTVPNGPAQAAVIRAALADGEVDPEEVGYLECHGTGTPLGDPIEVGALREVFGARTEPLVLGGLKANLGHSETAAGVLGLIGALLVLRSGTAPRSPLLSEPNPRLPLDWPVHLPDRAHGVRGLAGVSSFGISGTNAHVVLEGPPAEDPPTARVHGHWLIAVSAHSGPALAEQTRALAGLLPAAGRTGLPSVARTLAIGRAARGERKAVVARELGAVRRFLTDPTEGHRGSVDPARRPPRVGFLFTGQGAQHPGMGLDLAARLPRFAHHLDTVAAALAPHLDRPLNQVLADPELARTEWTQPALFALGVALARTLAELGCSPVGMVGHSLGEWTAAVVGGALSLEEGARLVCVRGQAMQAQPEGGAMVAVRAPEARVRAALDGRDGAELAAVNGPEDCTISGEADAVGAVAEALAAEGFEVRPLDVSHAFHSARMDGALPTLREALESVGGGGAPSIPIYSTVDGRPLGMRAGSADHWVEQTRGAVRYADALHALAAEVDVLVELGPRPALLGLAGRMLPSGPALIPTLRGPGEELPAFLDAVAALWVRGAVQTLEPVVPDAPLVELPSVAWQRERHWVEAAAPMPGEQLPSPAPVYALSLRGSPDLAEPTVDLEGLDAVADQLAAIREALAGTGPLTLFAPGALSVAGPATRAAAVGLAAVLRAERPDREVRLVDPGAGQPRWVPWEAETASGPALDGQTVLLTGASGALGRRIAAWLHARGAEVVAVSRTVDAELAALERVRWVRADLATEAGIEAALAAFDGAPDLVIHGAGAGHGGFLQDLEPEALAAVLGPKADAATALASRLPDRTRMVLFGSATAWLGLPGQGAYAAANAVLDGLAARRPNTVSIAWGPWQAGMAADAAIDWAGLGVRPLSDRQALEALGALLDPRAPARVAVIDLDAAAFQRARGPLPLLADLAEGVPEGLEGSPERAPLVGELAALLPAARPARLEVLVETQAEKVLGHGLAADSGFFESGMDSLGAVELGRRLGKALGIGLPATVAFDHPSPKALAEALLDQLDLDVPEPTPVVPVVTRERAAEDDPIAVVGLACRFPGADDADALWDLIRDGVPAIREVPPERWDLDTWYDPDPTATGKMYTRHGGFLDGIDQFDPGLFGIAPREATALDPQQRLLLETAWRALDDAGILDRAEGSATGVFVGVADRGWLRRFDAPGRPHYPDAWSGTGSEASFAAGRVAHAFGLHGPAIALNTTCSSSLVTLHLAAEALRRGDCELALAGGVHLVLDPESTVYLCQLGALSPTGACHTFDAAADGYVRGEGCGLLVLKRLSDAVRDGDRVRAVLRGSAINHDGHASGLTVPSGPAQTAVIQAALDDAGLQPDDIGWLQAHGTGTPLGDPIELDAAGRVFGERAAPLPVGTVKTVLGHCELAAGAAGAIAAVLALEHQAIPPHFVEVPNPELDLTGWLLPEEPLSWPRSEMPRRVGVSAFGLSGTNAHVIFEEGPRHPAPPPVPLPAIAPLAVHAPEALAPAAAALEEVGANGIAGLAGRAHLPWRKAVVVSGRSVRIEGPAVRAGNAPRVALLFTGQGSQWAGMHRALAGMPAYDRVLGQALSALAAAEPALAELPAILDDEAALGRTEHTQPALWAVEVAVAAQWAEWGLEPVAVAGHSVGEIAAATVAGALSLEDGARLAATRGRLMGGLPSGGAMLVAHTGEEALAAHLAEGIEITGVNDPDETAMAGPEDAVEQTATALEAAGIRVTRLNVSHAFHTAAMDPILDELEQVAASLAWSEPRIPLVSGLTGEALGAELGDPGYWRRQARHAVRFGDAVRTLDELGVSAFVECGPHPILVRMGQRTLGPGEGLWLGSVRRGETDPSEALRALGRWWEHGGPARFDALLPRRPDVAPAYPMLRRRLWPEGDRYAAPGWTLRPTWVRAEPREAEATGWVVLGTGAVPEALRRQLDASSSLDDLRSGVGLIDARSPTEDGLVARIDAARAVAVLARRAGARVWWLTRGTLAGAAPEPDHAAFAAWARCVYAEVPELSGGLVDLAPIARSARGLAESVIEALGHREVALDESGLHQVRLEPAGFGGGVRIRGTWLLTGGLGGLGRQVARWLADQGAEKLVLTARTPLGESGERAEAVAHLRRRVEVVVEAVDAGDEPGMGALLEAHRPTGIVHLAGTTDPQPVLEADADREAAVIRGKVAGAEVLDRLTREGPVAESLEHLVFFGSIAAAWGSRELGGYAAANAWLGALARSRRARGLPAVCVHWGPWAGGGMVDAERAERLERMGQKPISPTSGLRVLAGALAADTAEIVAARVDWPRFLALVEAAGPDPRFDAVRPAAPVRAAPVPASTSTAQPPPEGPADLRAHIALRAREVLRLDGDTSLDPELPLMELGFDSLMATELNNALLADGLDVPLGRLLGGPSVEEIAVMAEARLAPAPEAPSPASPEAEEAPFPWIWTHLAAAIAAAAVTSALWWALG